VRTYICQACRSIIIVGHPEGLFRRQARALARDAYSFLERLLHRGPILRKLVRAMEERFYLEPHRFRVLPVLCPRCGHRGRRDAPWWQPGLVY
jgi:hypothetical protein